MSVGTYIFGGFSAMAASGLAFDVAGARVLATLCKGAAALIGPLLSTYTAVLISNTAVPAWHEGRRTMPALFATGSAMSAAGAGLLFGPARGSMCGNLALVAAAGELIALGRLHGELGPKLNTAYKRGRAKIVADWARGLAIAGALISRIPAPLARRTAGAALLGSALMERFAVMDAGRISAGDPSYVIAQQTNSGDAPGDGRARSLM